MIECPFCLNKCGKDEYMGLHEGSLGFSPLKNKARTPDPTSLKGAVATVKTPLRTCILAQTGFANRTATWS
jgi:hypothetical protein